ncbi:DUF418 domain-containing protein [Streptomyces pseudovenezuelae]|uniref:DUF418 domain-containing protein n=1 Tax=Streptomyces pseudovenezuelae TaxID=67350 RepID=UPI0036E7F7A3
MGQVGWRARRLEPSIVRNTGVALAVVALCLTVAERLPRLTRLTAPVAAVGRTALTAYVLHIVALWLLTDVWYLPAIQNETMAGLPVLLGCSAAGRPVDPPLQARPTGADAAHRHAARAVRQVSMRIRRPAPTARSAVRTPHRRCAPRPPGG